MISDGKMEIILQSLALALIAGSLANGASTVVKDTTGNITYRSIGRVSVDDPAYVRVLQCGNGPPSLWITHFSALTAGEVLTVFNLSSVYPDFSSAKPVVLSSDFKWPNFISMAPAEIGEYLVVPDGFLLLTKETGGVYLLQINCNGASDTIFTNSKPIELTTPKLSWFYHMVHWRDMNGDGRLDAVTARAVSHIFGKPAGQLLWLEQPASDPLNNVPWTEHVLTSGPEFFFVLVDLDPTDDQYEVFAAEFLSEHLGLYVFGLKNNTLLHTRYIDETIGPAYVIEIVDLNNDGKRDLLVGNHVGGKGGGVFAYEFPDDILTGEFKKHILATNFTVTESGSHQAAPGYVNSFKPYTSYAGKPYIFVAGDGSQKAYLLTPTEDDFVYNMTIILSVDGVVGIIALGDIVGDDGWTEFIVPDYDQNWLYGYTFAP